MPPNSRSRSQSDPPPASPPDDDPIISLNVGGRKFQAKRTTLTRDSDYLAAQLDHRAHNILPDGSYWIDLDPDIFACILRWFRRRTGPIFFDRRTGHDFDRYNAVLAAARMLECKSLEHWIVEKKYLDPLTVECRFFERLGGDASAVVDESEAETEYHVGWGTTKVYVCPRGLAHRRGQPDRCVQVPYCRQARYGDVTLYDVEPMLKVLGITKRVVVDHGHESVSPSLE